MELLVIFDSNNQDTELGVALEDTMARKGWKVNDKFSFSYTKTGAGSVHELEKSISADVDAATFEAEWNKVNYVFIIEGHHPKYGISPGD